MSAAAFHVCSTFIRKMSTSTSKVIAVCQMTAKNVKEDNLAICHRLVKHASSNGAKVVFFPEACDFIGTSKSETLELAEPLNGQMVAKYCDMAKTNDVWLSLGGIHEKVSETKVNNAHVIIDNSGKVVSVYRKIHLFDVELPEKNIRLKESDYVNAGKEIVCPVPSPVGHIGLGVCYDMRFAELGLALAKMGADILTFPSAFTYVTGASHWEVLLRARAIETQCYVVAAAQTGSHNPKRTSWGHAMIIDPWGTVIAQCSEGEQVAFASVCDDYLKSTRMSMPVWEHRRYDIYPQICPSEGVGTEKEPTNTYKFGQTSVKSGQVFYKTAKTIAFTNKRCVLPGHVLVAPIRCAKRFNDLTEVEVTDLFKAVAKVQSVVENMYSASSSTICVQDGVHAGQTIEHVHVHIIPRRPGDFKRNDDIYSALEEHDKGEKEERSEMEMSEEAQKLQQLFQGKSL